MTTGITITPLMMAFLILMTGFAGFVDSAAGGGGLISLPAYLFAGLPPHYTYATNKFSAACGTTFATASFFKSGAIARGLHEATKIPILNKLVRRKTFVESQTHKNRWERNINVQDVFALSPDYAPGGSKAESLEHKHLLIVDDVCTTGATIISCCRELMKATDSMKFSILTIGYAKGQ